MTTAALAALAGAACAVASPFPPVLSLASLNGADGFRIDGGVGGGGVGGSDRYVASAGDVNGDGIDDFLVGAPFTGVNSSGGTYVVFGKDTAVGGAFPATLSLASLNGSNGFRLDGVAVGDYSGCSVSSAGDVNGDGVDDIVIGARGADPGGFYYPFGGSTYVIFGRDTAVSGAFPATLSLASLNGANGFRLDGASYDYSGASVASAGDMNADGVDDLLIGSIGGTYVVFGKDTATRGAFPAVFPLASLDGVSGFRFDGAAARSLAHAGDVNGDGVNDVLIGCPGGITQPGSTYVVFGKDTAASGAFPATFPLASLNGANGFRLDGVALGDNTGYSVASAGDVNGDGVHDILIGAPGRFPSAGLTYIVFGRDTAISGAFPAAFPLASLNGANGFRLDGVAQFDASGLAVASAGDVNGDGVGDVLIGAGRADPGGLNYAGSTYLVFGKDTSISGAFPAVFPLATLNGSNGFRLDGVAERDYSGWTVSTAGDVNGDGVHDFLVGASSRDRGGVSAAGSAYIVFGRGPLLPPSPFPAGDLPSALAIADFDGDALGRPDLAVVNAGSNNVTLLFNNGAPGAAPSFSLPSPSFTFPVGLQPRGVAAADIDDDSSPDLAVANTMSGAVSILLNDGSGAFTPGATISAPGSPRGVLLTDLDGDSAPDLVVSRHDHDLISVFRNIGGGSFGPDAPQQPPGPGPSGPSGVGSGDLDNDKDIDVVAALDLGGVIVVFPNVSPSPGVIAFGPPQVFPVGAAPDARPVSVSLRDLDGDGFLDILAANKDENSVSILRNLGESGGVWQGLAAAVTIPVGTIPVSIGAGEVFGDPGRNDLFLANAFNDPNNEGSVSILRNLSTGPGDIAFAPELRIGVPPSAAFITAGDVNLDSRLDLALANGFDAAANTDGQSAAGAAVVLAGASPTAVLAPCDGDANGDRVIDFLDLNIVLGFYAQAGPAVPGDVNADGVVDFLDLNIVLGAFGGAC